MDTQHTAFVSGWTHYCFEQESVFMDDLLLKLPHTTGESLPRVDELSVHWSGSIGEDEKMMKVRAAFFLCTGVLLQVTRARKDNARFSLRQGIPLGLQGKLSLQFLGLLHMQTSEQLSRMTPNNVQTLNHAHGQTSTHTIEKTVQHTSLDKRSSAYPTPHAKVRMSASGGSSDMYTIEALQPFHEFFGPLPGWEWRIQTTARTVYETRLLCSVWKIDV